MIDLKFLRENPETVKQNIKNKFQDHKLPLVDEVIELDAKARKAKQEADALRANRNSISKQIGALMGQGKKEEAMALKEQVQKDAVRLAELETIEKELSEKITKIMMAIPNIIDPSVPIGKDDSSNEDIISRLEHNLKGIPPVSSMVDEGLTPLKITERLLAGFSFDTLDEQQAIYRCDCSKERVERALISLGREELKKLMEEQETTEVCCHFCNNKYVFSRKDLERLLQPKK